MGKYRYKGDFLVAAAFLITLALFGMYMQDRNETARDEELNSAMLHKAVRVWHETHDKGAVSYPYVACRKTKIFHLFTSDCAMKIRSTNLLGFDSKNEAIKSGYKPCPDCIQY